LPKPHIPTAQSKALPRVLRHRTKLDRVEVRYKSTIRCAVAPRATEEQETNDSRTAKQKNLKAITVDNELKGGRRTWKRARALTKCIINGGVQRKFVA